MQTHRFPILAAISLFSILATAGACAAEDAYFDIPIDRLVLTEGKLPAPRAENDWRNHQFRELLRAYAVLDGPGEVFVDVAIESRDATSSPNHIVIHTPAAMDVAGRLYVQNAEVTGMVALRFKVPATEAKAAAKHSFYRTMENHYQHLLSRGGPGAAWFRYRAREARKALGGKEEDVNPNTPRWNGGSSLDDTYSLFTGNQALAENLQLEKALPPGAAKKDEKEVDVDSLPGITIAEIDWKDHIRGKNPKMDALAAVVPADQHAIFFRDFASMIAVADEADRQGTPVLQMAEPRSEDAGTRYRYERMLGLSLTGLGRLVGPHVVNSIAITGSDPYLRGGSDVAMIFEPRDADALKALLTAQIGAARQLHPDAREASGSIGTLHYTGARSSDRSLCTYLAVLGSKVVVVTNSLAQIERLAAVQDGKAIALSKTPEFTFFRDRYKLDDEDESALIVLSDATIRRWCSARWRIADSRRTRAAAVLANVEAKHLDKLVAGAVEAGVVYGEFPVPGLDEIRLTARGATSATYGSLEFLTPISEMKLDKVSEGEAAAYKRWRDTYETNWRGVFDPIAIRFSIREKKLTADMTVMPLIWSSMYRPMVDLATGAKLDQSRSDAHDSLMRMGMAININAAQVRAASAFALQMAPNIKVDPFSWVGQSIWLYADNDPFWAELAAAEKPNEFMQHNFHRAPFALQVEVSNGLKLAAFLVGLHGFIDQSAPGMTIWENFNYKDQPYVKITPSEQAKGQNKEFKDVAIYYRATGDALLITLNEALLKRAIDRDLDRAEVRKTGKPIAAAGTPLLGESLVWQVDAKLWEFFERGTREDFQRFMQQRSWGNLPILNEWKHRYADQDPVKLHERFFHARLIDPAGGEYRWNEKWQTMESSTYGCPAEPKSGPAGIAALTGLLRANLGLTFENNGLRARAEVDRK